MWAPLMKYWSISSIVLTEEAEKLWLEVDIISRDKNLFYIKWNWKEILFKSTEFWWNSAIWFKISEDKELSYKILDKYNFPIAKTYYIWQYEIDNIKKLDIVFPVIIKPIEEWHGDWVMMNILNYKELKDKLKESFKTYDKMIIQKQINWEEYRLLVIKWEVIMVMNRIPAFIIWNGINTIQELIDIENKQNPLRWEWYNDPLAYIQIDDELINFISKSTLTLNYIPQKKERIQLRWNSNIWTWWTPIDVTNNMCKEIKNTAIKSIKHLWLEFAGVDIMTDDITKPLSKTWWIILEVNSTPWIWWDRELTKVNTWKVILEKLFFSY